VANVIITDDFDTYAAEIVAGTNGRHYITVKGKVVARFGSDAEAAEYLYGPPDPPTCSLCDGIGHGYPGAGPCPLEERGAMDADADRERYGAF
jgi:hypothetical protein